MVEAGFDCCCICCGGLTRGSPVAALVPPAPRMLETKGFPSGLAVDVDIMIGFPVVWDAEAGTEDDTPVAG